MNKRFFVKAFVCLKLQPIVLYVRKLMPTIRNRIQEPTISTKSITNTTESENSTQWSALFNNYHEDVCHHAIMNVTPTVILNATLTGIDDDPLEFHRWVQEPSSDYVFDRIEVKATLIVAYTAVFCCCFIGNLLVIMAIGFHRRMRTITNFFLVNLAVADLCVSIFCIYQNLSWYLLDSWLFGDFLCRMNHFVQYLSCTTSVAILTMIAVERYLAIVHPIRSKHWITGTRLKRAVASVWLGAAIYSSPRFVMYATDTFPLPNGHSETICYLKRQIYNSKVYDTVNFAICYLVPLILISKMYYLVGIQLWRSGQWKTKSNKMGPISKDVETEEPTCTRPLNSDAEFIRIEILDTLNKKTNKVSSISDDKCLNQPKRKSKPGTTTVGGPAAATLLARRKVVRMLVLVVVNFAICNFPYHARKLWQYWSTSYDATSNTSMLATPITFLILFMNSGMNPILYAFMSVNFRKSMADVITCRLWRKSLENRRSSTRSMTTSTTMQNQQQVKFSAPITTIVQAAAVPAEGHGSTQVFNGNGSYRSSGSFGKY